VKNDSFYLKPKEQVKTKEEAREIAIDWQIWQSEQDLSYGEMAEFADYFKQVGKKFGLLREFKENGII
jgi:hypothetical protein